MEHKMRLADDYFDLMKQGKKKIEIRLNDEKRQLLNIGDIIEFEKVGNPDEKIRTKILDLKIYSTFKELLDNNDINECGKDTDTKESMLELLKKFYSDDEEEKYNALAIKVGAVEKSCGVAVIKDGKVLLVHQTSGNWSLTKGHVEQNETEIETATREVKEETNIDVKIIEGFRKVITYSPKENVMKDVVFFIGEPLNDDIIPQEGEIIEAKYVSYEEARELLFYKDAQDTLDEIFEYYNSNM